MADIDEGLLREEPGERRAELMYAEQLLLRAVNPQRFQIEAAK
jgi:hypothetical protein